MSNFFITGRSRIDVTPSPSTGDVEYGQVLKFAIFGNDAKSLSIAKVSIVCTQANNVTSDDLA